MECNAPNLGFMDEEFAQHFYYFGGLPREVLDITKTSKSLKDIMTKAVSQGPKLRGNDKALYLLFGSQDFLGSGPGGGDRWYSCRGTLPPPYYWLIFIVPTGYQFRDFKFKGYKKEDGTDYLEPQPDMSRVKEFALSFPW
ncbi:hypothetical protein SELMODRAFT_404620 [Selaginella moellendorffii]|uniref:Uncharacterized protein n=1 Tax=Selaginella moellendorffii TaxID=88036 RepID=D8QVW5_SELML|nr:hypothetical protein SELMODRAFT_404620 [Selaginella moellendorffii]